MLTGLFVVLAAIIVGLLLLVWLVGERGRFLPSTWAFLRQGGFRLRTLHGYVYGRWTPQYIRMLFRGVEASPSPSKSEHWLAKHYHGKVLTHEHARAIVNFDRKIARDLEQIIPYPTARNLVLQGQPDIVAYECVCRRARGNGCGPLQVCMVVGRPFTDFILEHQPQSARRLSREEALQLLADEHARGHVHSAWFKDAMLDRFYAICNCCKCCCGGIHEMVERGVPMVASSGYVAEVDETLCNNCNACVDACPFRALAADDGRVTRDWERCMGCGVCETQCPVGAVSLHRDERKGLPLDVRLLAAPAPPAQSA